MYVDRVWQGNLLGGLQGTEQTLETMAALVRRDSRDLQLRELARSIVDQCAGHDFPCEIEALFRYVRDNVTFRRDPVEQERVQDCARTLLVFQSGDCDDKCVALATLLGCLGHKTRFKVIGGRPGKYSHVYLEVRTGRGWRPLDPTPEEASPGWEARGSTAIYEIFHDPDDCGPLLPIALGLLAWWLLR